MVEQRGVPGENLPGYDRRELLRDAGDGVPTVSNFFPIERYYEASDKVLESFQKAFEARQLDTAYVYGRRYSNFYIKGITKHDYYLSKNSEARRKQANRRVDDVLNKLELVSDWMDAEELEKEKKRKALLKRQKEERERRQREIDQKRINDLQQRIQKQKQSSAIGASSNFEESALAKLQRLSQPHEMQQPSQLQDPGQDGRKRQNKEWINSSVPVEPDGQLLSKIKLAPSADLPPPILPPSENGTKSQDYNSPPSYHSIIQNSSYFGPSMDASSKTQPKLRPTAPAYNQVVKQPKKVRPQKQLPIRKLVGHNAAIHQKYRQEGKIQIAPLRTYQGRVNGSTNGCTVISACVVSKHMETHGGVSDSQIQSVIDSECVPLLRAIRKKNGLGGASLIIPSDVHDYLVDHKLLFQHKFSGVAGGNMADSAHLGELLNLLRGEQGKTSHLKSAATLFFREHVISIVKFPRSATEAIYDMVDSMPTCSGRASRTRCHSIDALKVHLEYYCTSKFSETNIKYIERNRWDDVMADFDPRVFQAFVWADLPKTS
mmetsp:Transcript_19933/g.49615  ORF Transcript_19933/g.49615 Transcript_19933/m.49615 type:complete len:546 (+) Transcript_19933:125-1762(+)